MMRVGIDCLMIAPSSHVYVLAQRPNGDLIARRPHDDRGRGGADIRASPRAESTDELHVEIRDGGARVKRVPVEGGKAQPGRARVLINGLYVPAASSLGEIVEMLRRGPHWIPRAECCARPPPPPPP